MPYFKDADDCIAQIRQIVKQLPNLFLLIKEHDYNNWQQSLAAEVDLEEYLLGKEVKFNLLNSLAIASWELRNGSETPVANPKLTKLNNWLTNFPELLSDNSFNKKIRNLEGFNFLASMSELSFASYLQSIGYGVAFEHKFIQISSQKKKDVDISFIDKNGSVGYAEIYMPHHTVETSGFFDPYDSDYYIKYKVAKKLSDKFGADGITGLNGQVLLVVNYAAFDSLLVKEAFQIFSSEVVYNEMNKALPEGVDGLVFFRDDFSGDRSFHFHKLLLKQ